VFIEIWHGDFTAAEPPVEAPPVEAHGFVAGSGALHGFGAGLHGAGLGAGFGLAHGAGFGAGLHGAGAGAAALHGAGAGAGGAQAE